ncbi:hypothetical protein A3709_17495 [Halioglobus sp. HI00S01]|uniref:DUF1853 family protein n=1 Tax=Halioglobus sp. HI00S01 TaxID=1822214 RepID=UPI0007C32F01|nr:DUF1853 family protein [Halioglobus sp. HI00S01]KZX58789.1 hypothetical protein A3709_17495 [Halioglobus sp. HI00S01]
MTAPSHKLALPWRNRAVRDLAWSCFSTPMIDCATLPAQMLPATTTNCQLRLSRQRRDWLDGLDQQPAPLEAYIETTRGGRLGLYFEKLWHFFLEQDPQVDLLATNLAVRHEGRTLGEFDVIYFCRQRRRHIHLELAVKFYLRGPNVTGSAWEHWLGPNTRDRLDLKVKRMRDHQLALSDREEAAAVLTALGVTALDREMEVKGRLFAPCDQPGEPPPGWPVTAPLDTYQHCASPDMPPEGATLLEREFWLAPLLERPARDNRGEPHAHRPQLVAELDTCGAELRRYFQVPETWPSPA